MYSPLPYTFLVDGQFSVANNPLSLHTFADADTDSIAEQIQRYASLVDYSAFDENTKRFVQANQHRLSYYHLVYYKNY